MQVITETIRLANPVALLWRVAKEDVKLSGNASLHNPKVLSMLAYRSNCSWTFLRSGCVSSMQCILAMKLMVHSCCLD